MTEHEKQTKLSHRRHSRTIESEATCIFILFYFMINKTVKASETRFESRGRLKSFMILPKLLHLKMKIVKI